MSILTLGSAVLAVVNIVVMWGMAHRWRYAWHGNLGLQLLWLPYDTITKQYGLFALGAVMTVVSIKGCLHKGEAQRCGIRFPRFARDDYYFPPELAAPKRFLATTGMSIHADGVNESEDATLSAKNALLSMIDLLVERGWSRQQAYAICSVAVDLKLSELVDVPNIVVSAFLPLDIFGK